MEELPTPRWWAQKHPEKYKAYQAKNKERIRFVQKRWRENNIEHARELGRKHDRARYTRDKERRRNVLLKIRYGITSKEYYERFEKQNGLCAICGQPETSKSKNGIVLKLAIDHCHKTKHIRGLLCAGCNKAIGHAKDSPEFLRKAAEYLETHAKDGRDNGRTNSNPRD